MRFRLPLLALLLLATAVHAQTALAPGQSIERDLATGDAHAYTLDLEADHFVLGEAFQETVDVVVTLTGPDGVLIREFDSPARGPESFQFTSTVAGTYTLTVTPFEDEEGQYAMRLHRVQPKAATPASIVDQQFAVIDRDDSPGGVVAVVDGGELVFAKPYGMANLTYGVPYELDTPTNIGSTSKQFTAFAIGLLAERGELAFDDDIRDYIPELPDFGETVTLRHLMTHTSGYREFLNAIAMGGRRAEGIQREEIIGVVQRQPELQNTPGSEWNYNNTAFGLLSMVVERVTGENFPDWMRANVFEPLGMTNTYVRTDPGTIIPRRAVGYVPGEDANWVEMPDLGGAMGAGGIYSTAPDLVKWLNNYTTATLGSEDLIREMTTPAVLTTGDTTNYGLGLFIGEYRGLTLVEHGGADTAHRSAFWTFPEIEGGVILLSNFPGVPSSASEVANAFFEDHLEPMPDDTPDVTASTEDFDPESFVPETFDAFAGRYELEEAPGFILTFRRDGDQYFTQATGQPEFPIFPIGSNRFELRVVDAQVTFNVEDDGSVPTITLHQNGDHPANRLADEGDAVALADYVGRYFSEELEAFYTLAVVDGDLTMSHRRIADDPITLTYSKEEIFTGGFPIAQVEFVRDDSGAVTGFRASSGRTRDVLFERVEG